MLHYFEFKNENSSKYWEITLKDKTVTTCYGKLNSAGKSTTKAFSDAETAKKEFDKLVKEKTKKGYVLKEFPFPFFGAGYGHYYEWAEVCVRFINKPNTKQIKQISELAPKPIKPQKADFNGKVLIAGSNQFVNMWIEEAYEISKTSPNKKTISDDDDENEDAFFYASKKAATAFEVHIEQWLQEIHAICPIEFAYRMEDGEAGGTDLSGWHRKSLEYVNEFIAKWASDETTFKQTEKEAKLFKYMLTGVFNFGNVNYELVPEKLIDTFFPDQKVKRLLNKADLTEALAYIKKHSKDEDTQDVIKSEIKQLVNTKNYQKINQLTAVFIDLINNDPSFVIYSVRELCSVALVEKNYSAINKLISAALHHHNYDNELIGYLVYATLKTNTLKLNTENIMNKFKVTAFEFINYVAVVAYKLFLEKNYVDAIEMYKLILEIKIDDFTTQKFTKDSAFLVFSNALIALENDTTHLPINKDLNYQFFDKVLKYGDINPTIYFNASCLYLEMKEYKEALECFINLTKHKAQLPKGISMNYKDMITHAKTSSFFSELRNYKPFNEWLKNNS